MIKTIRHRALKRLFEKDDGSRVDPRLVPKVRPILFLLRNATAPEDMNQPGYALHPLSGTSKTSGRCGCRATGE
ncbi:MAG: hypothetical protein ACREH3_04535 [Geminicoccales bacterium]